MAQRDLVAAQAAYEQGDAEASRLVHSSSNTMPLEAGHESLYFDTARSLCLNFASVGSVCVSCALVAASPLGVRDGNYSAPTSIAAAALLGGAGYNAFLVWSRRSTYNAVFTYERRREAWELDNFPEGEQREMVEHYVAKGMDEADAQLVISTMAKYGEMFVDLMMLEELGMPFPKSHSPTTAGLIALSAFAGAGGALLAVFQGLTRFEAGGARANHTPAALTALLGAVAVAGFQSVPHTHPPNAILRAKNAAMGALAVFGSASLSLLGASLFQFKR